MSALHQTLRHLVCLLRAETIDMAVGGRVGSASASIVYDDDHRPVLRVGRRGVLVSSIEASAQGREADPQPAGEPSRREMLEIALMAPRIAWQVLCAGGAKAKPHRRANDWLYATRITAAAIRILEQYATTGDERARMLLPVACRAEALLRVAPFHDATGVLASQVLAEDSNAFFWLARRARERYVRDLGETEALPALGALADDHAEADLRWLTLEGDRLLDLRREELPSSDGHPGATGAASSAPRGSSQLLEHVVQEHMLPRYELMAAHTACLGLVGADGRLRRAAYSLFVIAPQGWLAVGMLVAMACVVGGRTLGTTSLAVGAVGSAGYAFAVWAALRHGAPATMLWLLRMPAAAVIGLSVLLSLGPDPFRYAPPTATTVLFAGAFGVLILEVTSHGVRGAKALLRALWVGVTGVGHAILVSGMALAWIAPALLPRPATEAINGQRYAEALGTLAFSVAAAFATGIFLQVLWDEYPITYPLARLRWRRD